MQQKVKVLPPELLATHADWTSRAAGFAPVAVPPPIENVSASAAIVAAINAQVAEGHAMYGERLAQTASHVAEAAVRFVFADEDASAAIRAVQP